MADKGLIKHVHWCATVLSILGAALVALRLPVWGFGCWVVSNPLWIWWALNRKDRATALTFLVYEVTAVVGFVNWLVGSSGG
jgi:hypothetical protein